MNIFQKLVEVRKVVEYLQKEAKGTQYQYVSSSQVLASVRNKMNELGLLLIPRVTGHNVRESSIEQFGKEDSEHPYKRTTTYFTELDMTMTWVNADDPKETIECPWYGQGVDIAGEKGVGKALTYAEKYFILKQFNIPTDKDDPDSFQEKHDNSPKEKPSPNSKPTQGKTTTQTNKEGWTGFKPPATGDEQFAAMVDGDSFQNNLAKLNELQTQLGLKTESEFVVKINGWIERAADKGGFEPFEIANLDDLSRVDTGIVDKLIAALEKNVQQRKGA